MLFWLISKLQSVFLPNKINVKFLYHKIDIDYLDVIVKNWLNSFDASKLRINEDIINNIEDEDHMFILTNSPSFISTPFL